MSDTDLHVFALKFLALKTTGFSPIKILTKIFLTYSIELFRADPKICIFKKNLNQFFVHRNFKKQATKVANNWPGHFYFTLQPRSQPTA